MMMKITMIMIKYNTWRRRAKTGRHKEIMNVCRLNGLSCTDDYLLVSGHA